MWLPRYFLHSPMTLRYFLKSFADKPNSAPPALLWMNCELAHLGGSRCRKNRRCGGWRPTFGQSKSRGGRPQREEARASATTYVVHIRTFSASIRSFSVLVLQIEHRPGVWKKYSSMKRSCAAQTPTRTAMSRTYHHRATYIHRPARLPTLRRTPSHLRLCRAPLTFQSLSEISSVISTLNVSSYCLIALSQIAMDAWYERA